MKKIYLAIPEQESLIIKNILTNKIPDSELLYVSSLDEVSEIVKSDFFMLISPVEFVDLEYFNTNQFSGKIIILDPSANVSALNNDNVLFYDKLESFKTAFLTRDLKKKDISISKEKEIAIAKEIEDIPEDTTVFNPLIESVEMLEEFEENVLKSNGNKADVIDHKESIMKSEEINFCVPLDLEEYPLKESEKKELSVSEPNARLSEIINTQFSYDKWKDNKIIGVWSPLGNTGVTSFIINFAIYLKKYNLNIAVLEALTERPVLKSKLTQYNSAPENWMPLLKALYAKENYSPDKVKWEYRGIDYFPISKDVLNGRWTGENVSQYLQAIKKCNVGLVDLPSDKMALSTLYTVEHLDELWLFIDNRFALTWDWMDYIKDIKKNYSLNLFIIFTSCFSLERAEEIAKEMGYPLLATLPPLELELQMNEMENSPIIDKPDVRRKLSTSFDQLSEHILGSYVDRNKTSIWKKMKMLLSKVDSL